MSMSPDILTTTPPQLRDGERLDQKTFHELYKQTPPGFKAELIGGVVHVESPLKVPHGNHHAPVVGWLWLYHVSTPGTDVRDNTATILDDSNEPQPDAVLVIEPEFGGQSTVDAEDFAIGAPELVVEVADTTLKSDLTKKLPEYEQNGVREYVVVAIPQKTVRWFRLGENGYEEQSAENGVFRSSVFPGLWLNADALMERNSPAVAQTLQEGLATPEHAAFVAALQRARADQ
jgi:Uma2 family endonuclease